MTDDFGAVVELRERLGGDHQRVADQVTSVEILERLTDDAASEEGRAEDSGVDADGTHPAMACQKSLASFLGEVFDGERVPALDGHRRDGVQSAVERLGMARHQLRRVGARPRCGEPGRPRRNLLPEWHPPMRKARADGLDPVTFAAGTPDLGIGEQQLTAPGRSDGGL
jgi:hypothetical protein